MTDSPLAQWRRLIDDRRQWKLTPDYHRDELEGLARKALDLRMIDQGEFVEMCEIADAGRLTMLEDLAHQAFKRAGVYGVVAEGTGELLGEILSGTFMSVPPEPRGILGRITYDEAGQLAMFDGSPAEWKGDIRGLTWTRRDGKQARLIEAGRIVAGKVVRAITDADAFRLALNMYQVAREEGDAGGARDLCQRIWASPYRICPACQDNFEELEDCTQCTGLGFIQSQFRI